MAIVASRETYFTRATLTKSGAWILSFAEWPEIEVFVSDIRHAENAARGELQRPLADPWTLSRSKSTSGARRPLRWQTAKRPVSPVNLVGPDDYFQSFSRSVTALRARLDVCRSMADRDQAELNDIESKLRRPRTPRSPKTWTPVHQPRTRAGHSHPALKPNMERPRQ